MNENAKTAGQFHPCAPGQVLHTRGPVKQEDDTTTVEDSYYPLIGWYVTHDPEDGRPEFEAVFIDPSWDAMTPQTYREWRKYVAPYDGGEQVVGIEPAPQPAGMLTI
ncbi:hypothetical protein [Kribbella sp. DT2]|uniref:hypothetical protein n=1 Tax=Kribbella sp. DT2 TaxID=3393427 RepID=UPI003CEB6351